MVQFSDRVKEAMGLRRLQDGESVRASFYFVQAFALEGVTVQSTEVASMTINGHDCLLALSADVNAAAQALLSVNYIEEVEEWEREHRWTGPFLIAMLGPSCEYEIDDGFFRTESNGEVTTYDAFPKPRADLRKIAAEVLPELVTAVACQFNRPNNHLRFRPLESAVFGRTAQGGTVRDIVVTASGFAFSSVSLDPLTARNLLSGAARLSTALNPKVAKLFQLAHYETDDFKRFIYFFMALEVHIHLSFRGIDPDLEAVSRDPKNSLVTIAATELMKDHEARRRNLRDRFTWCAFCSWTDLTDVDLDEFVALKNIRDSIAHGSIAVPPSHAVQGIERLLVKVLNR